MVVMVDWRRTEARRRGTAVSLRENEPGPQAALEEEVVAFWKDNRPQIVEAFKNAVDGGQDFEVAFQERWSGTLYERVIVPAWRAQGKVIESIEEYVRDFASRRLVTNQGGPRLLFAYILRSYLDISVCAIADIATGRWKRLRSFRLRAIAEVGRGGMSRAE